MTLRHPLALAALFLGSFLMLRPGAARAEAPRFARGFVIYKTALSDQPVHYHGTLYLGADTSGPVWQQYDIGQGKPFYIANTMFVADIKFGALFEADFTTQQHVDYCKGIQARLATAAKASPLLASAATAASQAIQTEIDQYQKGHVRLKGAWVSLRQYEEMQAAQEKASQAEKERIAKVDAAMAVKQEASRRAREALAAEDKIRLDNYNRAYASIPAQNLIATLDATIKSSGALLVSQTSLPTAPPDRAALDAAIPLPFLREVPGIDTRLQILGTDAETTPAILTTYNTAATRSFIVQAILYLESTGPDKPFIPRTQAEITAFRQALDQYDPSIYEAIPDVIAANTVMYRLKDVVPNDLSTPFRRLDLPGYTIRYDVYNTDLVEGPRDRYLRLIIVTLLPVEKGGGN